MAKEKYLIYPLNVNFCLKVLWSLVFDDYQQPVVAKLLVCFTKIQGGIFQTKMNIPEFTWNS